MSYWAEIRTAYHVGRLTTVSAAAKHLGVHRATVIRHIDTLEAALGGKLFLRTVKGYVLTELGQDLMRVAAAADEHFTTLVARAADFQHEPQGEILVTSSVGAAPFVTPALAQCRAEHPNLSLRYLATERMLQLEQGEAHVAFRTGAKPQDQDLVVQPFMPVELGLYAHQDYASKHGLPETRDAFGQHAFISPTEKGAPGRVLVWYRRHIPENAIVFRASTPPVVKDAVVAGLGIGFMPKVMAEANPHLLPVKGADSHWRTVIWLVTHRDLHRSANVQALVQAAKRAR